ncbi:pentatricopeptide repeat-containing protein [Tripterygium wilfordii]|uniref:Pentatricopeptide repeat-containing protein n=1 Tax=Tripterygium wilfordii TaxID=458696 RepID=A0A7J7DKG6_TRIWF|nr:pentatricopeptide repeat-containing protein At5g15300-like [Tripterygium wilfordii]KAF5746734.1 pentatricopeptide repeat-containing protein [Tripterygium wilfordii]
MPSLSHFNSFLRYITTATPGFKFEARNFKTKNLSFILQSCKTVKSLEQIHAHLITTSQIKDTFTVIKLLESYAVSARNISIAYRVFNGIDRPDSYAWTTMIRGFLEAKDPGKAIEFYGAMRSRGVELNRFTFLFILKAYGLRTSLKEGRVIHEKIVKVGFCADMFIHNALINMYAKCGDIEAAYRVFVEMPSTSVVVWNTLITGFFNCSNIDGGRMLFDQMPERNVESWNVVIGGYCKLGHVDSARSLFDIMPKRDLVSWGSMISGYVHNGRAMEALQLFQEMLSASFSPDNVTFTTVLSACAQIGALDMGRWIHANLKSNKLMNDVFLATSLVDMYAKCGCIDIASELFHSMSCKNLCSWNAMLSGLAMHGYGFAALELFKEMESTCVAPNDVTFVAVLAACSHIGSVDEGRKQFNGMRNKYNLTPKIEHYGCMIDIFSRAGLIKEAKELIQDMPMEPNVIIWGALLNACRIYGYDDIGDDVVECLQKLASEDGGCYILLSNIYAAKNRWSEVEKIRKLMRELRPEKNIPGFSSIEVNGLVHEFFVEDRLNSNGREINQVVERLGTHLEAVGYVPNPLLFLCNVDQ